MKNKKLTVTIGIPAYNEERNIGRLLRTLVGQKEKGFRIQKIIVVSDASTDKTSQEVKKIRDKRVSLIENTVRIGQSASQNKLMKLCRDDILVILEGDTLPASQEYLMHLLASFFSDNKTKLVQGKAVCAKPRTFIGKVYARNYQALNETYERNEKLQRKICSGRGGRAFARALYKKLHLPISVPEDLYILFWCRKQEMKVSYAKAALIYFQPSGTLFDLIKGERKISGGKNSLENHFGKQAVQKHYEKNVVTYLCAFATQSPFHFVSYLFLKGVVIIVAANQEFTDFWSVSHSSKIVSTK